MRLVGIDVGGTKCHGVAVDESGTVLAELRHSTPHADELIDLLERMFIDLGGEGMLGVGVPGLITPDGVVRASPNLRGARDTAVGPGLREALGIAVHVENDATLAAYGEWKAGAAAGADNAVMITLGTGIGGGLVMGGRLQRGAHGFAGEIGHMVVVRDGVECPCGRRGCWERYASGHALRMLSGGLSGEEVFAAYSRGEAGAVEVIEQFAEWIALGLANLTNAFDPEMIVLGGGVIDSMHGVMDLVAERFVDALYSAQWRAHPRVVAAQLGSRAGAVGAAMVGLESQ